MSETSSSCCSTHAHADKGDHHEKKFENHANETTASTEMGIIPYFLGIAVVVVLILNVVQFTQISQIEASLASGEGTSNIALVGNLAGANENSSSNTAASNSPRAPAQVGGC